MKDLYKILGVAKDATPSEIKKAYRQLSKNHPDKEDGDSELFAQIAEAYEVLSNESKRTRYNETGKVSGADNNLSKLASVIEQLFIPMLHEYYDQPQVDLIKNFIAAMKGLVQVANLDLNKICESIERLTSSKAKISTKGQQNLIASIIENKIAGLNNSKTVLTEQIESLKWCVNYMQDYKYQVVERIGNDSDGLMDFINIGPGGNIDYGFNR